jgi:two-component system sensor histidine kinase RpfC
LGSLFWFELPLAPTSDRADQTAGELSGKHEPTGASAGAGEQPRVISLAEYYRRLAPPEDAHLHILVAEDNETNSRVLRAILEQAGLRVTLAQDGEAALDALQDGEAVDLMVLDRSMPGRDGLDVFRARRFMQPDSPIPTIMLSADATEQAMQECLEAGVDAYLTKPIASRRLLEQIAQAASRRRRSVPKSATAGSVPLTNTGSDPRPLLDPEKLRSLRALSEDANDDFFDQLVKGFCNDAERAMTTMTGALSAQDYPALRAAIHALEGSAGEFGAAGVAAGASRLKTLKPFELSSPRAQELLEQLRATLTETSQLLMEPVAASQRDRSV